MSTQRRIKQAEDKTDINISPMIDMVFILLIFFIVTTVFVDERGIAADKPMPTPDAQRDEPTEPIIFRVTAAGQVLHDGSTVTISRVETIVKSGLARNRELPVIVQAERNALSGLMVQVMDRATVGGARKISIAPVD